MPNLNAFCNCESERIRIQEAQIFDPQEYSILKYDQVNFVTPNFVQLVADVLGPLR